MEKVVCNICGNNSYLIFQENVLSKYLVKYFQCEHCEFIQTEKPYWLNEAYSNSLTKEDTGLIYRNFLNAKRACIILFFLFDVKNKFLDYGGGNGLFVKIMRSYGFNYYWQDPYTKNIFALGLEHNDASNNNYALISAFECFEHFENPINVIEKLLTMSSSILFSTQIFSGKAPSPKSWDYYYFSHGQHISLFSKKTLSIVAKKYNLNFYTNGKSFHLFTKKKFCNAYFILLTKLAILGLPAIISLFIKTTNKEYKS